MKAPSPHRIIILIFVVFLGISSCKTSKVVSTEKIRPMNTNRLIRKVQDKSFDYDMLAIKRIVCQYEGPDEKASFRANLKSEKDKQILLTISKINIPLARLLLTPDSVRMVNYLKKEYLEEGYEYLSDLVNMELNFDLVQSIISNDAFSYRDDPRDNDFREFVSYADSGMYILQSIKNRKLDKIEQKGKEDKIDRYLNKLGEDDFIVQHFYIDSKTFKIRKIVLDDQSNSRKVTVDFSDFEKVDRQLYPGNINILFASPEKELSMKIKLSKFSTEKDQSFNFNIPDKYDRIQ
ncbi:DUF4292 domain-containing protein [Sunxiuqinia dokdonensis]|uniref:DUF4292 domain-containing protein n=1 Tax=Sunxiuqinia dokdonensis TaxID=1409788 RepID=A0A0L8V6H2_9BACT|nr:DUF4292 domain-containing protein [Sunxiuqinia dokdonensis]KOH43787.1 hypothetical protein NC99_34090 [Sunxiuqinia dokdonensis]